MQTTTTPKTLSDEITNKNMIKVYEAMTGGVIDTTAARIADEAEIPPAKARIALKALAEAGYVQSVKGDKPTDPAVWSLVLVELPEAEDLGLTDTEFAEMLAAEAAAVQDEAEATQESGIDQEALAAFLVGGADVEALDAEMLDAPADDEGSQDAEADEAEGDETPEPVVEIPVLGTNAKKALVARAVLALVAEMVEGWDESTGVTAEEAQKYAALWMSYTSGRDWDPRLGPVPALKA